MEFPNWPSFPVKQKPKVIEINNTSPTYGAVRCPNCSWGVFTVLDENITCSHCKNSFVAEN